MKKKVIRITEKKLVEQISKVINEFDSEKIFLNALNKIISASKEVNNPPEDEKDLKNIEPKDLEKLEKKYNKKSKSYGNIDFRFISDLIINNIEGGYYHPRMNKGNMGDSGETMFGLDRKHGQQEKTALGRQFWGLIDKQNAKNRWPWNYMGGNISGKLKELAAGIMEPLFKSYSKRYLSPESYNIMMSDPRIYLNFAYATWNGIGWFQKFAKEFNDEVASGVTDTDDLTKFLLNLRRNSGNKWISGTTNKVNSTMNIA